jgi:hypothetical protein
VVALFSEKPTNPPIRMQLKLFVLPIKNLEAAEAEMNGFLRGHRVLAVKKEFVADGENSFWSFCVEYLEGAGAGGLLPGGQAQDRLQGGAQAGGIRGVQPVA